MKVLGLVVLIISIVSASEEKIYTQRHAEINAQSSTEPIGQAIDPSTIRIISSEVDSSTVYMSPEMKAKQNYRYYNNTFLYVTLREPYLKLTSEAGESNIVRNYFSNNIKPLLEKMQPKLRKAFDDHLQLNVASLDDLKPAAELLKELPDILAIEFLDRKNVFGKKATIDEMSRFKSKVKKQTPKIANFPPNDSEKTSDL